MSIGIDLLGKTALITGATRGIGKAIADAFIDSGADLILTGTKPDEIEQLNAEEKNPKVKWLDANFSSLGGIISFLEQLKFKDVMCEY